MAKKKVRKNIGKAIVHVRATFNNTIITMTDLSGETLCWDSAGTVGFKGARKATPFAAARAAEKVAIKGRRMGVTEVEVRVKGPGGGRDSAVTALEQHGLQITAVEDHTPIPHNGCRPKKQRAIFSRVWPKSLKIPCVPYIAEHCNKESCAAFASRVQNLTLS